MFVRQDVRGRNGSEGVFQHMTPHIDNKAGDASVRGESVAAVAAVTAVVAAAAAGGGVEVDESSDTFDTGAVVQSDL